MAEEIPNPLAGKEITGDDVEPIGAEGGVGSITSPEGVLMMSLAVFFTVIIYAVSWIPVIGWLVELIFNIFAAVIFGLWVFLIRGQRKVLLKFLLAIILEVIPYVDDVAPIVGFVAMFFGMKLPTSWIGFVYTVLNNG